MNENIHGANDTAFDLDIKRIFNNLVVDSLLTNTEQLMLDEEIEMCLHVNAMVKRSLVATCLNFAESIIASVGTDKDTYDRLVVHSKTLEVLRAALLPPI